MNDLHDAIIEDTFYCQCCGTRLTCGGNDSLIVEVPQIGKRVAQLALCCDCGRAVHDEYRRVCEETGVEP